VSTSVIHYLFRFSAQVKVILRVARGSAAGDGPPTTDGPGNFMSADKKHRQLTLIDPNAPPASDGGRRVGVAAPKMFAFDALFTQEDSQVNRRADSACRYQSSV